MLMQLVYKINELFAIDMKASDLFNKTKIIDIIQHIEQKAQISNISLSALPKMSNAPGSYTNPFPLTEVQQAYWLGRNPVFELSDVTVHGYMEYDCNDLNINRLEAAWNKLIQAHDALRIVIFKDGQQCGLDDVEYYKFNYVNADGKSLEEVEALYNAFRARLSGQAFDAQKWPLFEIACIERDGHVRLYVSIDGLILDAWSAQLLFDQWGHLYKDINYTIKKSEIRFRDYVFYLEGLSHSEIYQVHKEYWLNKSDNFPSAPKIPTQEISVKKIKNYEFKRLSRTWDERQWQKLKKLAHAQGFTPTSLLLSIFSEILFYWSNQERFAITLTLFNRLPVHPDINNIAGDFTALILLDIDYTQHLFTSFLSRTKAVHTKLWNNLEHRLFGGIPFLRHLASTRKQKMSEVTPPIVFTALLGEDESIDMPHFMKNEVYSITQTPQIWLDFKAYKKHGQLVIDWDYLDEIFPADQISQMFSAFVKTVDKVILEENLSIFETQPLFPRISCNELTTLITQSMHLKSAYYMSCSLKRQKNILKELLLLMV